MIRLSARGRTLLAGGALAVLALVFSLFVLSPSLGRQRAMPGLIARKQAELAEMRLLKEQWVSARKAQSEAERRLAGDGKDFSLLGFLEDVLRQTGIERKIQVLTPVSAPMEGPFKTEGIEIRMEGVTTEEMVHFLQMIEIDRRGLHITRAKIQGMQKGQERSLRITLQVLAYKPSV